MKAVAESVYIHTYGYPCGLWPPFEHVRLLQRIQSRASGVVLNLPDIGSVYP